MSDKFSKGDSVSFDWYMSNEKENIHGFILSIVKTKNPGHRCVIKNNAIPEIIYDDIENINKTSLLYTIFSLDGCTYHNLKTDDMKPAIVLLLEFS